MKVLIHKITGLYGHYLGNGQFATSSVPYVFPDTMNLKNFKKYVKSQEGCELQIENYDIKNIEIIILD